MIKLDREICRDLENALTREWLETNGLGGFASSTIVGTNTRRYHGLLTAATKPPVGRMVLLSKLEEIFGINGTLHQLSTNEYRGAIHPSGFQLQTGFRLDPFPVFTYEADGVEIEKSVFMVHGENTTVVEYKFRKSKAGELDNLPYSFEIRPLIAFRDYHSTTHENSALNSHVEVTEGRASIKPYSDLPTLHLSYEDEEIETKGFWYRNFVYRIEQERGLDFHEDLFSPFALRFTIDPAALAKSQVVSISIIASTELRDAKYAGAYRKDEIERRKTVEQSRMGDLVSVLTAASDQYIVARGEQRTIIAGYHWFGDWGRDTMISLPGLTLATGRHEVAKSILVQFATHIDQGMLPNRFPDAGETPEYNTVDATLWFFEAIRSLVEHTGDYNFVREHLYSRLRDIIDWHVRGTRYNIHVDSDGLLFSGEPGVQLTWMDAKVGDWVVTPRTGKAVEIQALWYNALRVMEQLAERFEDECGRKFYKTMADRACTSFNEQFWNEKVECLYDVVNGDGGDASIRPNQIFAISLTHSMVSGSRARSILRVVERELLTPRGLRTLSPADPRYVGRYEGDPTRRDAAYHQGTVWPWLMGPYITACVKTFGENMGREFAAEWLSSFEIHFSEGCLGQVSEIFDGDAPHAARGCAAQAWSVAELLRVANNACGVASERVWTNAKRV